jgi:hypothetical protein
MVCVLPLLPVVRNELVTLLILCVKELKELVVANEPVCELLTKEFVALFKT